ncbi:hypothetical protein Bca4012_013614 [Brassica carinata]
MVTDRPNACAPAPDPFEVHDPFATSNSTPPPHQTAVSNPFSAYQPTYQLQQQLQLAFPNPPASNNPFGDFGEFPVNSSQILAGLVILR